MWFSVVCSLIDSDTRHHSGQNVVDSGGVAESVHNKFQRQTKFFFSSARDQKRDSLTRVACLDSYRQISQISSNCGKI